MLAVKIKLCYNIKCPAQKHKCFGLKPQGGGNYE